MDLRIWLLLTKYKCGDTKPVNNISYCCDCDYAFSACECEEGCRCNGNCDCESNCGCDFKWCNKDNIIIKNIITTSPVIHSIANSTPTTSLSDSDPQNMQSEITQTSYDSQYTNQNTNVNNTNNETTIDVGPSTTNTSTTNSTTATGNTTTNATTGDDSPINEPIASIISPTPPT